jgi:DNA-binding Lrp family transcriptional regulator
MLDSLYTPDTRERRAADLILAAAAKGRQANLTRVARAVRMERGAVVEVRRRLEEAGVIGRRDGTSIP